MSRGTGCTLPAFSYGSWLSFSIGDKLSPSPFLVPLLFQVIQQCPIIEAGFLLNSSSKFTQFSVEFYSILSRYRRVIK